ncbi:hypothetical protein [uncultured Zoogloea sp.]|uniref:hypothetical protein n=1 Tax=uncultured Zoogloea sp. TaxID=160237 RepID=UPI002627484A|nr:hypothetical protein [uncultured Zoogloea sp.]
MKKSLQVLVPELALRALWQLFRRREPLEGCQQQELLLASPQWAVSSVAAWQLA